MFGIGSTELIIIGIFVLGIPLGISLRILSKLGEISAKLDNR